MFWLTSIGATVAFRSAGTRMWLLVIVVPLKASVPPAPLNMPMPEVEVEDLQVGDGPVLVVAAVEDEERLRG